MRPELINIKQVEGRVGMCKSTIYKLMNNGDFPKSVKPAPSITRWRLTDIKVWENSLALNGTSNGIDL